MHSKKSEKRAVRLSKQENNAGTATTEPRRRNILWSKLNAFLLAIR